MEVQLKKNTNIQRSFFYSRMGVFQKVLQLFFLSFPIFAEEANQGTKFSENMEIGGIVTLDATFPASDINQSSMSLGTVELMANVRLAPNLLSGITLLSEENLDQISIDRAMVEYSIQEGFQFVFGQQLYPHGLLTTRLISDPIMLDEVETVGPGGLFLVSGKFLTSALGVLYLSNLEEDTSGTIINNSTWKGVAALDFTGQENLQSRLSFLVSEKNFESALGFGLLLGNFQFDTEGFKRWTEEDLSGYYFGLALPLNDLVTPAIRFDGLSPADWKGWQHFASIGIQISLPNNLFSAIEYSVDNNFDTETQRIALQFGLESTLNLPGIQRATLTNP